MPRRDPGEIPPASCPTVPSPALICIFCIFYGFCSSHSLPRVAATPGGFVFWNAINPSMLFVSALPMCCRCCFCHQSGNPAGVLWDTGAEFRALGWCWAALWGFRLVPGAFPAGNVGRAGFDEHPGPGKEQTHGLLWDFHPQKVIPDHLNWSVLVFGVPPSQHPLTQPNSSSRSPRAGPDLAVLGLF